MNEIADDDDGMIEIMCPEEISAFASEDEEDEYWSTHCLGETYFARVGSIPNDSPLLPPIDRSLLPRALRQQN